jgi:hypothetical protein
MPTTKQRISINLPDEEYAELAGLAERHNLSMAWIGRKAVIELLERCRDKPLQLPLKFSERAERPEWLKDSEPH